MNVGSLFSGVGGFDLGLERAGMRVVWQCESDPYCRAVLRRHWPDVPCHEDVRALRGCDVESVDVVCGGFPCQDLSYAGKGAGIDGARSGLWAEMFRVVCELRPRYVLVENVPALLARGLGRVVGDLASCGYDAEWDCLPASAFGAPHHRDRIWIVAYPRSEQHESAGIAVGRTASARLPEAVAHTTCDGRGSRRSGRSDTGGARQLKPALQDADECALQSWRVGGRTAQAGGSEWWAVEPAVGRVAYGVPNRLDQLAALGNALVPQVAEWIGRRLLIEWERAA